MISTIWERVWNFIRPWVTIEKGKPMRIWRVLFALLVFYLLYQIIFTWSNSFDTKALKTDIPENKVAFVVIQEKGYGFKKSTFGPLLDSLTMWNYDKDKQNIYFKFKTLLPTDKSKVMMVYDKGFDSFDKYAEVVSVNSFPYTYVFQSQPMIKIYNVEKDGTVSFDYKGKKIRLEANDSYRNLFNIDGFHVTRIKITNYGLFDKKQFKKMKAKKEDNPYEMKK